MRLPWNSGYYLLRKAILSLSSSQKNKLLQQSSITEWGEPILEGIWKGRHKMGMFIILSSQQPVANKITNLDLRGCFLPQLPSEIKNFHNLQKLLLCSNGLQSLPNSICSLPLHTLSLGKNHISKLPRSFKRLRDSLCFLSLGDNKICNSYSYLQSDLYFLRRGSIGTNTIPEPIGPTWMIKKDAQQASERFIEWFRASSLLDEVHVWLSQALNLWAHLDEPMIDEIMFQKCFITKGTLITPYQETSDTWIRYALRARLPVINEGAVVHPSLWNKNLHQEWSTRIPNKDQWQKQEDMSI